GLAENDVVVAGARSAVPACCVAIRAVGVVNRLAERAEPVARRGYRVGEVVDDYRLKLVRADVAVGESGGRPRIAALVESRTICPPGRDHIDSRTGGLKRDGL